MTDPQLDLSVFVVARDAARLLPAVIANLRRLAAEVLVVVDAASVDDSAAVAVRSGARVVTWPVGGSYESVLNEAAAACHGSWVLYGHDDELWPPDLAAQLPALLQEDAQEFVFPRKHLIGAGERWIVSPPWYPDWQVRLRHRRAWQAAPWPRQVHSSPAACGRRYATAAIWHYKFIVKSAELRAARLARWGELWATSLDDHYKRFSLPENYAWESAALEEAPPAEAGDLLRSLGV